MARKLRKHHALMLPGRYQMIRTGQIMLLAFMLLLFLLGRQGNPYVQKLETQLMDVTTPVLSVAATPFDAIESAAQGLKNWVVVYQQNQSLKAENRELLKWQAMAKELQVENQKLQRLLNVSPARSPHYVTTTIMSDHGSAYSHAALVGAGSEDGLAEHQAVISERGLMGRIVETGNQHARLLLLTDVNSRIPVMNERTREKMILIGKSNDPPALSYVASDTHAKKGDRIITSGDGGVFPKNIPVGKIANQDRHDLRVDLFANIADIEYVSVIQQNR